VTDDGDMLVRTMPHGRSLAETLGERPVALMRGHGSVVAGANVREVVMVCVYLEQNARLQLQALALGNVRYLSDIEVERMGASQRGTLGLERAWTTWLGRITMPTALAPPSQP